MMKKIVSLLLVLVLSLCAFCACNPLPDESDEELISIFSSLLEESKEVNRLLFGEGILPAENGEKIGAYTEADAASLAAYGVDDVEDIKEKAKSVYSLATCAWIEKTLLSSSKDDATGQVLTYSRYLRGTVELADKSKKEVFLVYTDYKSTVGEVDYSDFAVVEKRENLVKISLTITVTHEGNSISFDDTLTIFREEHGWRLDAPSYATYPLEENTKEVKNIQYKSGSLVKAVYNEGETFDCAGAKITVTYEDGTTATVDVTAAMTGTVVLTGIGEKDVAVSYTEEGVTYTAYIPITVINPTKDAAIAALKTNANVTANPEDKGISKLIDAYTALITDAPTDGVAALAENFAADVKAYVDAKAACLAVINDDDLLDGLYTQYLEKAYTAREDALVLYNTATELAAFAEIAKAYETAIEKLFADQEFYEGGNSDSVTEEERRRLLIKIEEYAEDVKARKKEVLSSLTEEEQIMYYEGKYNEALYSLDKLYKYINLAVTLNGLEEEIDNCYNEIMEMIVE